MPYLATQFKWFTIIKLLKKRSQIEGRSITKIAFDELFKPLFKTFIPENFILFFRHRSKKKINTDLIIAEAFEKKYQLKKRAAMFQIKGFNPYHQISSFFGNCLTAFDEINSQGYYIEDVTPLADIRVLEFLINLPPEFFLMGGWRRGIVRHAMFNILPTEVQWRRNKTMFSPDYFKRVSASKKNIATYLENINNMSNIAYYINHAKLTQIINAVKLVKSWDSPQFDNSSIIAHKALINLQFCAFLNKHKNLNKHKKQSLHNLKNFKL